MRKIGLRPFAALAASLLLVSGSLSSLAQAASPQEMQISEAHNRFGFKIFSALQREAYQAGKKPENVFISPASLAWALEMLLNGAQGGTFQAMVATLEISGLTPEAINAANADLMRNLQQADPKVELAVANSLWGKAGITFLPDFLALSQKYFSAQLGALDAAAINAWVKEKTKDKIAEIIRPENITPETILVLVNALYFKGLWKDPFDKAQTAPRPFTPLVGAAKPVPMMNRSNRYAYYEDAQVQAIRIPYGSGRLAFYAVLPALGTPLPSYLSQLDAAKWKDLSAKLTLRPGKLTLPRFKTEYGKELSKQLGALGMQVAFGRGAEFAKVASLPPGQWLEISAVEHKTFVEVNEEGTEAAAVTAVSMRAGSAPPPPEAPFTMVVDRPFFCMIQDSESGLILFLGAIVDLPS